MSQRNSDSLRSFSFLTSLTEQLRLFREFETRSTSGTEHSLITLESEEQVPYSPKVARKRKPKPSSMTDEEMSEFRNTIKSELFCYLPFNTGINLGEEMYLIFRSGALSSELFAQLHKYFPSSDVKEEESINRFGLNILYELALWIGDCDFKFYSRITPLSDKEDAKRRNAKIMVVLQTFLSELGMGKMEIDWGSFRCKKRNSKPKVYIEFEIAPTFSSENQGIAGTPTCVS